MLIPILFRLLFILTPKLKLLFILLTGGIFSVSTLAMTDALEKPAIISELSKSYLLMDVAKAGKNYVAVGAKGHILLSKNKGIDWQQVEVPTSVLLTSVHFPSANQGWAVGHGGIILHSQDGGKTWVKQFDGYKANKLLLSQAEADIVKLESSLRRASSNEREDLEYELEEAQYTLEDLQYESRSGPTKPLLDVLFLNNKEGFAIGAYGLLFKTTNGGKTWSNFSNQLDNPDGFHLNAITHIKRGILIIAGEAGVLHRSKDNGETWKKIDDSDGKTFYGLASDSNGTVLAYGILGHLLRSEDAGLNWVKVETGTTNNLTGAVFGSSSEVSVVGDSGIVLYSGDSGKTFSKKNRTGKLSYTSLLLTDNDRIVVTSESGFSIITPSGESFNGFLELSSRLNDDYFAAISNYAMSNMVMTLTVKTPKEQCASYEVMDMVDRIQWRLENTQGVESTASLATVSKHVTMALNEGDLKWFELSRNESSIKTSIQREPGLVNPDCSINPILIFLNNFNSKTLKNVTGVMNELVAQYSDKRSKIIKGQSTKGFEAINLLTARASQEKLGGSIALLVGAKDGNIFTKSYMEILRQVTNEVSNVSGVDRSELKSLFTPNMRWLEVTEDGFQGGTIVPDDYDGSSTSFKKLRSNIIKSGQNGHLVKYDYSSTFIFVPFFAVDPATKRELDLRNSIFELARVLKKHSASQNIILSVNGYNLTKYIEWSKGNE